MHTLYSSLFNLWSYCWKLHFQVKNLLKLNFTALGKDELLDREAVLGESGLLNGRKQSPGEGRGEGPDYGPRQMTGLIIGPLLFLVLLTAPAIQGMSSEAQKILASTAWIATWWITEAVPIPITSLLPVVLFPLTGSMAVAEATAPYANPNVFLFLGGFMIAVCIEKWNLHRRIALQIINIVGASPNRIILGFMVATGFLSMWISNTATTMMMLPIGLAVILQVAALVQKEGIKEIDVRRGHFNFGTCLMLSIAYSASIGGVATLIGTPPNIIFAGAVEEILGVTIGFAHWMLYGLPVSAVFMFIAWLYMTRIAYPSRLKSIPGGREVIVKELHQLGSITREEKLVAAVFIFVALSWITRSFLLEPIFPLINDTLIAVVGALLTFIIPVNLKKGQFLNDWETAVKVPWGILLLFGGGLAIAAAFSSSGLAQWIGMQLTALQGAQLIIIIFSVAAMVIFLTEITSNTATTSMMMPIMAALAAAISVHPYALMITAATAASYAFMLPVATPPNAVIFGSGYITIPQMARAGLWLNITGIVLITLAAYLWLPVIFSV